ncbi:hypothetical protein XAC2852_470093 [Xanthomonas citri pv. citri]|nr:hypothetical protein XAC2852_470093 [Xanthomonas citri pv. citri]
MNTRAPIVGVRQMRTAQPVGRLRTASRLEVIEPPRRMRDGALERLTVGGANPLAKRLRRRAACEQPDHTLDDIFDSHSAGIDQHGVFGRPQWRHHPLRITGITGHDLAQQVIKDNRNTLFHQLFMATTRTFFGTGGQKHLVGSIGKDHRAHVAPVGNQAGRAPECALALLQGAANLGNGRNGRGQRAGSFQAQLTGRVCAIDQHAQPCLSRIVEFHLGVEGAAHQRCRVGDIQVGPARSDSDSAIQCTRIEVMPAQPGGHDPAHGALAGTGGAIDGEDGRQVGHSGFRKVISP